MVSSRFFKSVLVMLVGGALGVSTTAALAQEKEAGLRGALGFSSLAQAPAFSEESQISQNYAEEIPPALRASVLPPDSPKPSKKKKQVDDLFEPQGVKVGAFFLKPSLDLSGLFSDNPQGARAPRNDFGFLLSPSLVIESDWVRHAWRLNGKLSQVFYGKKANDTLKGTLDTSLRLDVREDTTLEAAARYAIARDPKASSENPTQTVDGRLTQTVGGDLTLKQSLLPLVVEMRSGADVSLYSNPLLLGGGREDNRDRQGVNPFVSAKVGFYSSAILQPFITAAYEPRLRFQTFDRTGLKRSSEGVKVGAGVELFGDDLWQGRVVLLYRTRDYDDSTFKAVDLFGIEGEMSWKPATETVVTATASSEISETIRAAIGGYPVYQGGIRVEQRLRESLKAAISGSASLESIPNARDTLTLGASVSLFYALNRYIELFVSYDFTHARDSDPAFSYQENKVQVGTSFRL